jgi:hypothetical protein
MVSKSARQQEIGWLDGEHMIDLSEYSQAQRERLVYIDFRLYFTGSVSRMDLMDRFGVGGAAATRDFGQYREIAPENTELDSVTKLYVIRSTFSPLIAHPPERVLTALSQGYGYGLDSDEKPLITHESVSLLSKPKVEVLAPITRAIHLKQVVKISYTSSSGQSEREIVPFAIGCDGLRWHVRAFDRKRGKFGDFVLTRIGQAEIQMGDKPRNEETPKNDDQWNRMLELPLVPHPDKDSTEIVKRDYDMQDGVLKLRVRAAMAGYVLQQYHVDCSADHSIGDKAYRLWLRDPLALYGVESSMFAPGYKSPNSES